MNHRVFLIGLCALAICEAVAQCATEVPKAAVRPGFRLPNLFNFEQFKAAFGKHYKSLAEEAMRHRLFLARAFQSFISMVKFRHFQADYFLKVSHKSDETVEERLRLRINRNKMGGRDPVNSMRPLTDAERRKLEERKLQQVPAMEPSELRERLAQIEEHKSEPEYKPMADELERLKREERVSMLVKPGDGDDEEVHEVSKKNPLRNLAEGLMSNQKVQDLINNPMTQNVINSPLAQNLINNPMAQSVGNFFQNVMRDNSEEEQLPDEVFSDLRESGCLLTPEHQGGCGCCYSFSTLGLFEYLFCRATGHQVSLSKQYLVSCAGDWLEGLYKCNGAYIGSTFQFVDRYGMEPATEWPYEEAAGTCPYVAGELGSIRLERTGFGYIDFEDFDEYLKERPIQFAVDPPVEFDDYGGGVYAPTQGCLIGMGHAMLIVGHGRQDGKEYYLFRNSYGTHFGEQGYVKFSKEHMRNCTDMLYGIGSSGEFSPDAFEQLKAIYPEVESKEVPVEGRWPRLDPNSEAASVLKPLDPDFIEGAELDPYFHRYAPREPVNATEAATTASPLETNTGEDIEEVATSGEDLD